MLVKKSLLFILIAIVLFSCMQPETGPPILDGEQQLIIENGTYEYEVSEGDTFLVFHIDYYTSRDSCAKGDYSIIWPGIGGIHLNIFYAFPVWEYAGTWYERNGRIHVSNYPTKSTVNPIFSMEAYNGVEMLTATDTLEFVGTDDL